MLARVALHRPSGDRTSVQVPAPHSYDGIGQALRSAYRDHRVAPDPIVQALNRLNEID